MVDVPRGLSQADIAGFGLTQGRLVPGLNPQPTRFIPTVDTRGTGQDKTVGRLAKPVIITAAADTPGPQDGTPEQPEQVTERNASPPGSGEENAGIVPLIGEGRSRKRRHLGTAPANDPDGSLGRIGERRENRPRRRRVSPYQTQRIARTSDEDVALEAFTAEPFRRRVNAGRRREQVMLAESAFLVVATGETIIYSPLREGGANPSDHPELATAGMAESVNLGLEPFFGEILGDKAARGEIDGLEDRMMLDDHSFVGAFHFHAPMKHFGHFSAQDIVAREQIDQMVGEGSDISLDTRSMWFGVFLSKQLDGKPMETKLFMYQGPPTNSSYQAHNFATLAWDAQQRVLEDSGMRTIVVDIPFERGAADLSPLAVALRQQNVEDEPSQPGYRTRPEDREVPRGRTHVIEAQENPDDVKDRDRIGRETLQLRGHKNYAAPDSTGRSTGPLPASGGPRPEGDRDN